MKTHSSKFSNLIISFPWFEFIPWLPITLGFKTLNWEGNKPNINQISPQPPPKSVGHFSFHRMKNFKDRLSLGSAKWSGSSDVDKTGSHSPHLSALILSILAPLSSRFFMIGAGNSGLIFHICSNPNRQKMPLPQSWNYLIAFELTGLDMNVWFRRTESIIKVRGVQCSACPDLCGCWPSEAESEVRFTESHVKKVGKSLVGGKRKSWIFLWKIREWT